MAPTSLLRFIELWDESTFSMPRRLAFRFFMYWDFAPSLDLLKILVLLKRDLESCCWVLTSILTFWGSLGVRRMSSFFSILATCLSFCIFYDWSRLRPFLASEFCRQLWLLSFLGWATAVAIDASSLSKEPRACGEFRRASPKCSRP